MLGYEVLKKLADGSAAEAFLARQEGTQDRVILEILRPELASDSAVIQRFMQEAQALKTLEHPNVTRRMTTGRTSDGRLFVVTEPVEGESLSATLWSQGSLQPQDVVRLAIRLCDALEYLHQSGVVHGGVKPDNVYLSGGLKAHNPKLLAYGLALFRGRKAGLVEGPITQPEYLAPECLCANPIDARSDIYGMGILIYEALTGFPPFIGSDAHEVLRKQLAETPTLPASCEQLTPIVQRCLQADREYRYQSALELKEALERELHVEPDTTLHAVESSNEEEKAGDILSSYELVQLIGEGAMGRVFSARHVRLRKKVAVKLLRPEKARDHSAVERFFHEARTANQINHTNIVQIFDFIEEQVSSAERRVYFVMELLEGISLGDLLRYESLSIERTLHIVRQLCDALEAAHALGVVHRDIKPDNIFLITRSGARDFVKVLDFGVAKLTASHGELPVYKTMKGAILGTPAFMSPEQAAGLETDHRTDIYAVGNVLYQALSGRLPFQANTYGQLLVGIVSHPAPPLGEATAGGEPIPDDLRELVMSCLAKDPEQRPQGMGELREAITPASHRVRARKTPPTPIPRRHASAQKHDRKATYAAVAMTALAAFGAAWISRKEAPPSPMLRSASGAQPPANAAVKPDNLVGTQSTESAPETASVLIEVNSVPPGAWVVRTDSGEMLGRTPLATRLPRHPGELTLRLELLGHVPAFERIALNADARASVRLRPIESIPRARLRAR